MSESFKNGLKLAVLTAATIIVVGWVGGQWLAWLEVRNFVIPIIRQQQAQAAQRAQQAAPAPKPASSPEATK